jgi:hypothetical protein
MQNIKRIVIATFCGLLFGFVCYGFAASGDYELARPIALQIISSRTLMGFAIGLSCWRMGHWSIHGLVMGFLFSLPMAFSGMVADIEGFSKTGMFLSTVGMGMIYGLLTELITSMIFKARVK